MRLQALPAFFTLTLVVCGVIRSRPVVAKSVRLRVASRPPLTRTRAVAHNHPAYDTLFVELAVRESCLLATFGERVLGLFSGGSPSYSASGTAIALTVHEVPYR